MNKFIKKVITGVMTVSTIVSMSSITAMAPSPSYTNSVGSAVEDIQILGDGEYSVVGNDTNQNKKSAYTNITLAN